MEVTYFIWRTILIPNVTTHKKLTKVFWNKKKKLPITDEDKIWVDEDLNWLRTELGKEHFMEIQTITPTKDFYNRTFDGTEKDAEFILERTME